MSDDYKQGYRDGFRDAQKQAQDDKRPPRVYRCIRYPDRPRTSPCECDACELPYGP